MNKVYVICRWEWMQWTNAGICRSCFIASRHFLMCAVSTQWQYIQLSYFTEMTIMLQWSTDSTDTDNINRFSGPKDFLPVLLNTNILVLMTEEFMSEVRRHLFPNGVWKSNQHETENLFMLMRLETLPALSPW